MNTLLNYIFILAVVYYVSVKLCPEDIVKSSCTDCMFVVIFNGLSTMVVSYNELVSSLVKLRGYILIILHLFDIQKDLHYHFFHYISGKLLIYYLLLTFVIFTFQPILSQKLEQKWSTFSYIPEIFHLGITEFLTTYKGNLL